MACGEPAPGRPGDIFVKPAEGTDPPEFDAQFINMRAVDFVGTIVPGYLTQMLGYAAEDDREPDENKRWDPSSPGPLIVTEIGEPLVMRLDNRIDPAMKLEASVHLHGGHTPAHSDGHADFLVPPGEARDYFYPNAIPKRVEPVAPPGPSPRWRPKDDFETDEAPSTAWYHDHAEGITASNALKGLAGMYVVRDAFEKNLMAAGFLPDEGFEMPIAIRDVCLEVITDPNRMTGKVRERFLKEQEQARTSPTFVPPPKGEARIHFDPFDHDGTLGNLILLNGVPQPRWTARQGVWRLRLLNASLARFYELRFVAVHRTTGEARPLDVHRVGKDSWLLESAILSRSVFLGMANRADVLLDLRGVRPGVDVNGDPDPNGEDVYLINTLDQRDGRGPGHGDNELGNLGFTRGHQFSPPRVERGTEPRLMRIVVQQAARPAGTQPAATRPAAPPATSTGPITTEAGGAPLSDREQNMSRTLTGQRVLRPFEFIEYRPDVMRTRVLEFERGNGAWQINGRFYDAKVANAVPSLWSTERWILRNKSGGWWHPIHIHLESHQHLGAVARDQAGRRIVVQRADYDFRDENGAPIKGDVDVAEALADGADPTIWNIGIRHDTTVLGPNTEVHVVMRFRTFQGPFVFHCHNLNHEDMMMMFQFDPRLDGPANPDDPSSPPMELPATDAVVRSRYWFFRKPEHGGRDER